MNRLPRLWPFERASRMVTIPPIVPPGFVPVFPEPTFFRGPVPRAFLEVIPLGVTAIIDGRESEALELEELGAISVGWERELELRFRGGTARTPRLPVSGLAFLQESSSVLECIG